MMSNDDVRDDSGDQRAGAGRSIEALASLFDPWTFDHLSRIGPAPGWRVWEVGAGGPSVPAWLAEHVGPDGRVLATDVDTSWIPASGDFEVRRHDVATDPPPDGPFDLVHARLVLGQVRARERALAAMVSVLRPGGWLVVEDVDSALQPLACADVPDGPQGEDQRRANRLKDGVRLLMAERGVDLRYGRTLPRRLREVGLEDVGAEAFFPISCAACADLERATIQQVRSGLVAAGMATEGDIAAHLAAVAAGRLDLATSPLVTAWGRKHR